MAGPFSAFTAAVSLAAIPDSLRYYTNDVHCFSGSAAILTKIAKRMGQQKIRTICWNDTAPKFFNSQRYHGKRRIVFANAILDELKKQFLRI